MTQIGIRRTETLAEPRKRLSSELHNAYNTVFMSKGLQRPFNAKSGMQGKPLNSHGRTHMTAQERREIT